MIHLVAIVLGVLIMVAVAGFCYVINSVLRHFGLDTEEIGIAVLFLLVVSVFAWIFGSIILDLIGLI